MQTTLPRCSKVASCTANQAIEIYSQQQLVVTLVPPICFKYQFYSWSSHTYCTFKMNHTSVNPGSKGAFSNWPGFLLVRDMDTWSAVSLPHCSLQHPDKSLCRHFSPTEKEGGSRKSSERKQNEKPTSSASCSNKFRLWSAFSGVRLELLSALWRS